MRAYRLTKQAFKTLTALAKNDPKIAKKLKEVIEDLRNDLIGGESLQGYSKFKIIRVGKFRLNFIRFRINYC
jgi:mRNA-degrading endonuclease RelE of RelBE toxin-antitoxin system